MHARRSCLQASREVSRVADELGIRRFQYQGPFVMLPIVQSADIQMDPLVRTCSLILCRFRGSQTSSLTSFDASKFAGLGKSAAHAALFRLIERRHRAIVIKTMEVEHIRQASTEVLWCDQLTLLVAGVPAALFWCLPTIGRCEV